MMITDTTVLDAVTAEDRIRGAKDSTVTIIEYGDFECPNCKQAAPVVAMLLRRFTGLIRVVFRHFPLEEVHPHALVAAEAAEAAAGQGRFWEMHDLLFAQQPHFQLRHLVELAEDLALDVRRFSRELQEHVHVERIRENVRAGRRLAVRATPTFYVNGNVCDVSFGIGHLASTVTGMLAEAASPR
jgi:protein-disulfide isomerase